ncbi:MAG: YkgJ family cysteine cluster protein [Flavobacteriales bacterium]|nr:YkgJ family cysteine cluster protein [Flavobacteriales bacterium]
MNIEEFRKESIERKKENEKFFKKLKNKKIKNLDHIFQETHEEVFKKTDCLDCANCCKTTSPIFKERDIKRIAKDFNQKPKDFIAQYLKIDEDYDYVLQQSPCTFLNDDNTCFIYDIRPDACREYPHTNQRKMNQILPLTMQNTLVCPAVLEITERLKGKI